MQNESQSNARPNVVFILADDMGWGDLSCHGSRIKTPNLDRLAANGVEMMQHYVCPVCTPTRVSLMTGRYPGRFGAHATKPSNEPVLPDGYSTLAGMLRDSGYETALFGKWHLGSDLKFAPNNYGFDESYGSMSGGVDPYTHLYKKGPFSETWHHNGKRFDERGHATDLIADRACEWISERTPDKPWFCYVPFTAVHSPIKPKEHWQDQYELETFDANADRDISFKRYAAYASHFDYCIGRLIETLKVTDQFHNTLVVFTSDNGAAKTNDISRPIDKIDVGLYPGWQYDTPLGGSNAPFRGHKGTMYEGGIRTPGILHWHGTLPAGEKLNHPVAMVDWMPTLAHLCNAELPEASKQPEVDGMNIWPLITGDVPALPERNLYWNVNHKRFAVRCGNYKLIQNTADETIELFDVASDPYETRDLAADMPDRVKSMLGVLEEFHAGDDVSKRADAPV